MYLTLESTEELRQLINNKVRRINVDVETDLRSLIFNRYIIKIQDTEVGVLKFEVHKEVKLNGDGISRTAFHESELKKIDTMADNASAIEYLLKLDEVKDLTIDQEYISFIYLDKYQVKKYARVLDNLETIKLDTRKSSIVTVRHFSQIVDLIEESIKKISENK